MSGEAPRPRRDADGGAGNERGSWGAVLYSDNYGDVEDGEDDDGFWARDFVLELGGVVPAGRVLTGRDGIDFSEESWVLDGDGNWTRSAA